jgi:hypothetical protein
MPKQNGNAPRRPTTAKQWKARQAERPTEPLELPSGNVALVRPVGMPALIKAGVIPNSLLGVVQKAIRDKRPPDMKSVDWDEQTQLDAIRLFEQCAVFCVVEPKVETPPDDPDERDPDVLYADDVEIDDLIFIFQFAVGGTRDLEQFRGEQAAAVAAVLHGDDLPRKAKPPPRNPSRR